MSSGGESDDARLTHLNSMRKKLKEVQGGDRLKLWLEYTHLQDEDPELQDWMTTCLPYLHLQSWSMDEPKHPKVVFKYTVQRNNCNRLGNAHGGQIASLFDFVTSMPLALINKPGFWFYLGVSRTLNVTYLKPIPNGEEILVEAELVSIGRTLCSIRGTMRRESDGTLLATCEHGKYNTDLEPSSKI
ncbi:hypothetical protein N8I77_000670 [Diaporthe amygdali]|uniref:Thioesterase domain-containing protein n=1 Tax=Phomopsis amygdali TaxID=1214568 RepID=A0AAD9W7F1_PHOAM|nr:uncharacterized protein J7T55_012575 [Diaporthe amygdali]KAJ0115299.1 hypothetical protein J7T55_012575 [Diaporthe amygdali]KAK2613785.1 hypothetical protein N8I77_000670 [Diaporthe amygdali]